MSINEFNLSFDDLYAHRFQYQDTTTDENIIIQKLKNLLYQDNSTLENEIDDYLFQFYIAFGYPISLDEIKAINRNQHISTNQFLYSNIFNNIPHSIDFMNIIPMSNLIIPSNYEQQINENNINNQEIIENTNENETENINDGIEDGEEDIESSASSHDSMPDLIPNDDMNYFPYVSYLPELNNTNSLNTTIEIFLNLVNTNTTSISMSDVVITTNDESIQSLETKTISDIVDIGKCSICMSGFEIGDTVLDIECKHNFHKECLEEYLKKYNHICPICRHDIGKTQTDTGNTS
jgi:hypothetical protein